jgi:hypothetical protein
MSSDDRDSDTWVGKARLLTVFAAGPVCALTMQSLAYAEVPWACKTGRLALVHVIPAVFVVLTLIITAMAWSSWSRSGRHGQADGGTAADRTRFIALAGLLLSVGSLLVIVVMWIPLFVFDPCAR